MQGMAGMMAGMMAGTALSRAGGEENPGQRPNLLIVLTDDQHFQAMGCMGNPIIQTPQMDALAAQGALFANAFVTTPICCTSRASILTGMYAWSNGVHDFQTPLPPDLLEISYPVMLRRHGYYTGFVGKYGVGTTPPADAFDFFFGLPGNGRYIQEINGETQHMTGLLADQAVAFLESCPDNAPFCLSLSTRAPHAEDYDPRPFPPDPALEHLYCDVEIPAPELVKPEYYEALPPFLKDSEGRKRWENNFNTPERYQESVRDYYRMITGVDHAIGRLREVLRRRGMDHNTVILFTSDNGFLLGERGLSDKWYAYESSIRVPFILYDPRLPEAQRGRRVEAMALNIDIAPTLLDLAGIEAPSAMQGRSLLPWLRGETPPWREHWFFEHRFDSPHHKIPMSEGVRSPRWKYFRWINVEGTPEELYDLEQDPLEIRNLAGNPDSAATLAEMRLLTEAYRETLPKR